MIRECFYCKEIVGEIGDKKNHSITSAICSTCWVIYKLRRWFKRSSKTGRYINIIIANDLNDMLAERKRY